MSYNVKVLNRIEDHGYDVTNMNGGMLAWEPKFFCEFRYNNIHIGIKGGYK